MIFGCRKFDLNGKVLNNYFSIVRKYLNMYNNKITILTANTQKNVKTILQMYDITFNGVIFSIEDENKNKSKSQKITKANYVEEQNKPFIFIDDSPKEIEQMLPVAQKLNSKLLQIKRPKKGDTNFKNYGMFNQKKLQYIQNLFNNFSSSEIMLD